MKSAIKKKNLTLKSKITIYDSLEIDDSKFLTDEELHFLLKLQLVGISTKGLPNRTRSKVVKSAVCSALGYDVPKSFKKCQPRFLGQNFDTYVQKSNNLQIWNEEVSATRRYVLIQVSQADAIVKVKVISGQELAKLDTTGTLTRKYQAKFNSLISFPDVFSKDDTTNLKSVIPIKASIANNSPSAMPGKTNLLPISVIASKLKPLIGKEFVALAKDQDRNRGAILHSMVCNALGYSKFNDNGKFPDVLNQLLEVKLQMSPTIDLGLVLPNSDKGFLKIDDIVIKHCDVRYAVFEAKQVGEKIKIINFALSTGLDFFSKFTLFSGKVLNKKIQISLPKNFFNN